MKVPPRLFFPRTWPSAAKDRARRRPEASAAQMPIGQERGGRLLQQYGGGDQRRLFPAPWYAGSWLTEGPMIRPSASAPRRRGHHDRPRTSPARFGRRTRALCQEAEFDLRLTASPCESRPRIGKAAGGGEPPGDILAHSAMGKRNMQGSHEGRRIPRWYDAVRANSTALGRGSRHQERP